MLNCCIQLCILIKLPHYKHFLSSLFSTFSLLLSGSFVISDNLYAGSVFGLWLLSGFFSFSCVAGPPPAGNWVDVSTQKQIQAPCTLVSFSWDKGTCVFLQSPAHGLCGRMPQHCLTILLRSASASCLQQKKIFSKIWTRWECTRRLLSIAYIKGACCLGLKAYPALDLAMQTVVSVEQPHLLGLGRLQSTDFSDLALHASKCQKKSLDKMTVLKSVSLILEGTLQNDCSKKHVIQEIPNAYHMKREIQENIFVKCMKSFLWYF